MDAQEFDELRQQYYDGNTYACVAYSKTSPQECGQIVPPSEYEMGRLKDGVLDACVRTEDLSIACRHVEKLYTPNFFLDNWGWFVAAAVIGYWIYKGRKQN